MEKDSNHKLKICGNIALGRARHGRKSGPELRIVCVVQEVFRLSLVSSGDKSDEADQTRRDTTRKSRDKC